MVVIRTHFLFQPEMIHLENQKTWGAGTEGGRGAVLYVLCIFIFKERLYMFIYLRKRGRVHVCTHTHEQGEK